MSKETKKQSFIQEATAELCACAIQYGFNESEQETLEELATQLLKESFKNGLNAGYRKAAKEKKEEPADKKSK